MWQLKPITPKNLKLLVNTGCALSIAGLFASGWSDFQNVRVYEVSTGLQNQPSYRVITRQFDRQNIKLPVENQLVSVINQATPNLKILLSLSGLGLAVATLAGCIYEENHQQVKEYAALKTDELRKIDIDTQVAAQHKVAQEKAVVHAMSLVDELMNNPHYQELQRAKQRIEYGEESETEQIESNDASDLWESTEQNLSAKTESEFKVTKAQANQIKVLYKETKNLPDAIRQVLNITSDSPDFKAAIQQIKSYL